VVSEDEVSKIISHSSNSFSDLDPIPASLLKQCLFTLLPTLTNILNLSLVSGTFPDQLKSFSVILLLKKYNLDKEDLSNYRPISHLSLLSKLLSVLLRTALLRTSLLIISSIHINLPTPNIILLSLLFSPFMTASLSLCVNKKSLLYVSLMFLLPS